MLTPEETKTLNAKVEAMRPLIEAASGYTGQIRCHGPYCSFSWSPPDCPLCHGTGWHYCRCGKSESTL